MNKAEMPVTSHGHQQIFEALKNEKVGLEAVLTAEDKLEDIGLLAANDRTTCFTCQSWADHEHEIFTGKVLPLKNEENK